MTIKRNPVPAHIRRGIRLSLGIFLASALGYGVFLPLEDGHPLYKSWVSACKWGAITCVVVTAPVIGKVAQVSFERTLGTIIGGTLGLLTFLAGQQLGWNDRTDGPFLVVCATVFAYITVIVSNYLKLDVSGRLTMITYLLVTFGSNGAKGTDEDVFRLCLTRVTGIVGGVILSIVLSILIMPKSASINAVWEVKAALDALVKLGDICWKKQRIWAQELLHDMSLDPRKYEDVDIEKVAADDRSGADMYQKEAEKRLTDVYNSLQKVKDSMTEASTELLCGTIGGRWCFLPGLPCFKGGTFFQFTADVDGLSTSLRKVARLMWTLHLNFEEGFDENMQEYLQVQYPASIFPRLMETCQGSLQDMAAAFPNEPVVRSKNLHMFIQTVEGLIRISDYYRRRILKHMTDFNYTATSAKRLKAALSDNSMDVKALNGGASEAAPVTQPPAVVETTQHPGGESRTKPLNTREPSAYDLVTQGAAGASELSPTKSIDIPSLGSTTSAFNPGTYAKSRRSSVSDSNTDNFRLTDEYMGSPREAFEDLPEGLTVTFASKTSYNTRQIRLDNTSGQFDVLLPRLKSAELLLFPDTMEGHVSQVRWYSFHFLMETLAEELEETYQRLETVMQLLHAIEASGTGGWWRRCFPCCCWRATPTR